MFDLVRLQDFVQIQKMFIVHSISSLKDPFRLVSTFTVFCVGTCISLKVVDASLHNQMLWINASSLVALM